MNCKTCAGPCALKGSNIEGDCEGYKPMSHYDQIRSMSVEEMADHFSLWCCRSKTYDSYCKLFGNCKKCWLDWLKIEAEEDER